MVATKCDIHVYYKISQKVLIRKKEKKEKAMLTECSKRKSKKLDDESNNPVLNMLFTDVDIVLRWEANEKHVLLVTYTCTYSND